MKKISIIGGGPVGTMTGILIKETCGDAVDVTVYEQRPEFTRNRFCYWIATQ
jgi:2-polyprenyl-6-methoxyphenol hydroxylase-like FAD-dependent oxidoreductase